MLWKVVDEVEPPDVNNSEFGWDVIVGVPTTRTGVYQCSPPGLMNVVACGCSGQSDFARKNCTCANAGVPCRGQCVEQNSCQNRHTKQDADDCPLTLLHGIYII